MLVRRFLAALAVVTTAGAFLFASPLEAAPRAMARSSVTPKDVIAGSSSAPFTFEVMNIGEVPLTTVRVVRPSTTFRIVDASAPAPWSASVSSPDTATFGNGLIPPGGRARFTVLADVLRTAGDRAGAWSVLTSTTAGDTYKESPGTGNSIVGLSTTVRVLRLGRIAVTEPLVDDGSATTGQQVDLTVPVTNEGSSSVTVDEAVVTGDAEGDVGEGGALRAPAVLAPGETGTLAVDGVVLGTETGEARVRLTLKGEGVLQAGVRVLALQAPVSLAPAAVTPLSRTLECAPEPARGGEPLACTVVVDKSGGPAFTFDASATSLSFADGAGTTWSAPLESPLQLGAGDQRGVRLRFAATEVPADLADGTYPVTLAWAGTDANGAPAGGADAVPGSVTVDSPPTIVEATTGRQADGTIVVHLRMSEQVRGTHRVDDWAVVDDEGTLHPLVTVTGSGSAWWTLVLAASPPFDTDATPTVTYTPGDLADRTGNRMAATTVEAADGIQ